MKIKFNEFYLINYAINRSNLDKSEIEKLEQSVRFTLI